MNQSTPSLTVLEAIRNEIDNFISNIEQIYRRQGYKVEFPKSYIQTIIGSIVGPYRLKTLQKIDSWVVCQSSRIHSSNTKLQPKPIQSILPQSQRTNKNTFGGIHPQQAHLSASAFEIQLQKWITDKNNQGDIITLSSVRQQAMKMRPNDTTICNNAWVKRYVKRHPRIKGAIREFIPGEIFSSLDQQDSIKFRAQA